MKALVLAAGELNKPEIVRQRVQEEHFDLVLGADSGARYAQILGVELDAIIGDLDSTPRKDLERYGSVRVITHPPEKDETDLELALLYAVEQGAGRIVIAGALGGRLDMTLSNILLLNIIQTAQNRVEIWHGEQTAWLMRPPGEDLRGNPGDTISLIPVGGDALNVLTTAMKYPLRRERLYLGQTRGLSNVIDGPQSRVDFTDGLLLTVHTPGRA